MKNTVPRDLMARLEAVENRIRQIETLDYYVLKRVLEAGRANALIDDEFIHVARECLDYMTEAQLPSQLRQRTYITSTHEYH